MNCSPISATRILILLFASMLFCSANARLEEVKKRVQSSLSGELERNGFSLGEQVFLRAYKKERRLEVWIKPSDEPNYKLFKSYFIAGISGALGPKRAEGDRQMPEGFYEIKKSALNPNSRYHLSFNVGYPNSYDRWHKRTGSFIMVHGSDLSIGCYAMTDAGIEEIYLIVEAALLAGQKEVPFHSYPFNYTRSWERVYQDSPMLEFWRELKPVHDYFEQHKRVPQVKHRKGQYYLAD